MKFKCALVISICFLLISSCKKSTGDDIGKSHDEGTLSIYPSSLSIPKNESIFVKHILKATLSGTSSTSSPEVRWNSTDTLVVTVDKEGYVTGVDAGETDITATRIDGKGSAKCHIVITDDQAYKYRLILKDKGVSGFSVSKPQDFLSAKAIERRRSKNIPITESDLPISPDYLKQIKAIGGVIVAQSKWLGTVSVHCENGILAREYKKLPFVKDVQQVWQGKRAVLKTNSNKINNRVVNTPKATGGANDDQAYYAVAWDNIHPNKGEYLHSKGYSGTNIRIAVIDAGFEKLNTNPMLNNLHIIGAKSFVYENADPYAIDSHGVWVTSCMATNKPGQYVGTAPDASYLLLRTEDQSSEFAIEEDYWAAAIEYADSVGVDMVNTSLYYTYHDGITDNYKYENMNGKTAMASRAANIASEKGIFIVACAGNDNTWVGTPGESPFVLAVGSINKSGNADYFTSYGLTVDGRMKPDVMALGGGAYVVDIDGSTTARSGTSYASPIICGLAACLWQAYPQLSNKDLMDIIRKSADRYIAPIVPYGYGIPDMQKAMQLAQAIK
jgi:hypothetical protein